MIYFIRAGDVRHVKIGRTENIATRLAGIQIYHPKPVELLRLIEGSVKEERWLHYHFASERIRGEWFLFVPEMLTVEVPSLIVCPTPLPQASGSMGARDMADHLSVPDVIEKLGGLEAVSRLFGLKTTTAVMNWRAWNAFPQRLHLQIDRICREKSIEFDVAQPAAKPKRKRAA